MNSVVGLFASRGAAEKAAKSLDLPDDRVSVVAPGPREPEDSGIGPALGGAVGGALGAAAGSSLGTAAATLLLPGVGPVVATGVIAALVFGVGGVAAGAAAGDKVEHALEPEPRHDPKDVFFYHEALRRGRAIVLALAENSEQADSLRSKLGNHGAESLDTTQEAWWHDVREMERAAYEGDFSGDEHDYRRGFVEALQPANRAEPLDEGAGVSNAYRKGYERGYKYLLRVAGSDRSNPAVPTK